MTARVSVVRVVRLLGVLVVIASVAACDIDFTEPDLRRKALLHLEPTLTDDGGEALDVDAVLYPGMDRYGSSRTVVDSLRILGSVLAPERLDPRQGLYHYSQEWSTVPDSVGSPVHVQAPRIEGIDGAPPHVTFSLVRRSGPDTVVVSPRDTIYLHIVVDDTAFRSSVHGAWELTIGDPETGEALVRLRASTTPPDLIAVPAGWLPDTTQVDFPAELNVSYYWTAWDEAREYAIEADARSTLRWTLRIVEE